MKKIKILYVVSTLRQSGPTNQLLGIVKNLNTSIFEAKVLTLSREPANSMLNEFLCEDINVSSLNLNRYETLLKGKSKLKKRVNELCPDIIHTSGVRADELVSKLKQKPNHCMTIRNFAKEDLISKFGPVVGKILAKKSLSAIKKCKYPICCSYSLKDKYKTIIKDKNFFVIQNGVDISKYNYINTDKKIIRKKLKLPEDKMIFISVGSLIKRKDPLTMIKAFKSYNKDKRAVLIILGEGELEDQIMEMKDSSIILEGNVNNVSEYLKAADVFISTSKSEGLPNAVLEAGSVGNNMLLSSIPQHQEIFKNNLNGIDFFCPGSVSSLQEKMESMKINSDSSKDISIYIREEFNTLKMSNEYQNIYIEMYEKTSNY